MCFPVRARRASTWRRVASPRARSRCAAGTGSFFATVSFAVVYVPADVLPFTFPSRVRFAVCVPLAWAALGAEALAGRGLPVIERAGSASACTEV